MSWMIVILISVLMGCYYFYQRTLHKIQPLLYGTLNEDITHENNDLKLVYQVLNQGNNNSTFAQSLLSFHLRLLNHPWFPFQILLVIAHPDDECMFFGPTLLFLERVKRYMKWIDSIKSDDVDVDVDVSYWRQFKTCHPTIHVLCLSNGNHQGLGSIREVELKKSLSILGIQDYKIIQDSQLLDGPENHWKRERILDHIEAYLNKHHPIKTMITFDSKGVSGHLNHIAIYHALKSFQKLPVFHLKSWSLWMKYSGPLWSGTNENNPLFFISPLQDVIRTRQAMQSHTSQYVWFRRLFVYFARYFYMNEYVENEKL